MPQQLHVNRIIFEHLGAALLIDSAGPDFPAYLDALAAESPAAMRDRVLAQQQVSGTTTLHEIEPLLADPPMLHDLLTAHVRALWERHGAPEWARVQRALQQHVDLLQHSTPGSGLAPEVILGNLRTYVAGSVGPVQGVHEMIFVPSPHTGRYVTQLQVGSALYLFFDAELHARVLLRDTPVKQMELVGRLSALTEPARLRVLSLLAEHGELTLQDLMTLLDTSQPNVSRYLKSLGNFVWEQRGKDGRKRYRLVPSELDLTFQALQQTLLAASAPAASQQEESMQPQGLARYLDNQGAVASWPRQTDDLRAVLGYLAERFEEGAMYTEKQVNAVLRQHVLPHVRDHVTVRRDMIDSRFLQRSGDGMQYWRSAEATERVPRVLSDEEAYSAYWGGNPPESAS
jgi:DNA-binding transcriptional ArsR family regulator